MDNAFASNADAVLAAGYPARADAAWIDLAMVVVTSFVLMLLVTLACGPVAALLVELFPAQIRYSATSLP